MPLLPDRKLARVGREALDLIAAHGWNEGLVVPLPQGGSRMGLVSMVGHRLVTDPAVIGYLTLISICLHSHART
ncbi:MAG: autoinducer binding domain-containing protein, partial [Pseudomonadota bacterium]|nr:autoinducer binding domain-containing protein [Pseudomonadota bacterium]